MLEADEDAEDDAEVADGDADDKVDTLDPALFAAAFARRDAAAREVLHRQRTETKPARSDGLARGRDGRPITRVRGERTVIRALEDDDDAPAVADGALEHVPLDRARALPSSRARAFKKQKLGLRARDVRASALEAPKAGTKSARREEARAEDDDPLGLADPAFLPGGEFAQTGRSRRRRRAPPTLLKELPRGGGGRVAGPVGTRTMGPAAVFARGRAP